MVHIVFVTQANKIYFSCRDKEAVHRTIRDFEDCAKRVTKEMDQILWADDSDKNHMAMVRVSQVIGYYVLEPDESYEKLARAQTKIANALEKSTNDGDGWKKGDQ